jgi:TP901 family phage tail tape measure protein
MADVNANIGVNIDTSEALAQLKALQRQISQFHTSIAKSSESAALAQRDLQKNFLNSVNAIGAFSAELRTVRTTAESFTDSLEKNKFSMREYFRFAGGSTKTFGKLFKSEFDTIGKVAEDRVKRLQTQYIKLGRDTSGAMKAIAIMPNQLDMGNFSTQSQMAAQKQAIFNQLVKQGSTNLLNFGKNTQWAGRQLMVGFTLPLAALGTVATRTFMDMEAATIKFRKVYGDLFTPETERQQALEDITALGQAFTQYGISVSQTVGLAAEAAAAGFSGVDLQRQTTEATRLSILGQVEAQKALETTISLQNAFKMSSEDLASSIDFLNAVENQTVVSLDDITTAIPKVAPVIQQLGGDVKDLAFFMAAMKEGGINASEGANALKSGLAALINPTTKASAMLASYGININKIIEGNQGDLKTTVVEFAQALDTLDPLTRARAIEQLFGKFQFARLSTLFSNVINETGQASRVLDLAGTSIEDLAGLSESELGITADSAMNKFRKSIEDLKFALVPVGQTFLQAVTPIVEFAGSILEKFNNLSSGVKKALVVLTVAIGAIGPVALMTFGLLANGIANIVKGAMILRNGYLRLTGQSQILGEQTEYLTMEQIDAAAASHSLDQSHARLVQTFTAETGAIGKLIAAYQQGTAAAAKFAAINPGMMRAPNVVPTKRAKGKPVVVGGTGNQDTELALLTPGETVIPADMSKRYGELINGMIAGNIPGYRLGKTGSGMFQTSIGKAKEATDLYKAPSAIKPQTIANTWASYEAEVAAMTTAAEEFLREAGFSAEQITKKINQLVQKQASHITEQIQQIQLAGETVDVKQWNASNLITDFGGINNYLNSIHKVTETLDEQEISKLASQLNMSIDEFKAELKMLSEGIHPTTRKGGSVLGAIAEKGSTSKDTTLAYQSKAVSAGMKTRLSGDFYETVADRAYDPTKDVKSLEQVNAKVVKLKTQVLDSFNISDEIASLSGKNVQSLNAAWSQLSMQAKERLIALSGDVNAFTTALMQEAKDAGIAGFEVGKSATTGVAKGAQTASESKATIKTGQDIGRGLEVGMDSMQDDVAMSGQELGAAAVGGTQTGAKQRRIATRPAGPPNVSEPVLKQEATARKTSVQRLDSMNKALMGGTFALTSLAGAGSMAGGTIGKLSNQVMKYSGLLFALMSVTQLLTQAQFARLIAERAATAGILKKTIIDSTTGAASFSRTTGLFAGGIKELLPNLKRFGGMIARFAGIPGLVISAGIGIFSLVKMANKHREDERRAIMGLADAANMTSKKLATLGDIFGVKPGKNPLLETAPSIRMTTERRGKVEELKSSDAFQKDFADTISGLREATKKEAEITLKSISLALSGQGYTKAMIADVVDALREEAGKTDVKIDLKSLDLGTEAGQKGFAKLAADMTNELAVASKNGYKMQQVLISGVAETGQRYSYYAQQLKPTVALQKAAAESGQTLFNMMTGLAGGLESGAINAKSFNQGFDQLQAQIKSFNAINPGSGLLMLKETIKLLNPETQKLFEGLQKDTDIMLMMRAQALGLTYVLPGLAEALKTINAGYQGNATELVRAQIKLKEYEDLVLKTAKITEDQIKKLLGGNITPGDTKKSAFQLAIEQLQKQREELINTSRAYEILQKAGIDAETALKYASDSVIALGIATGKIDPTKINQVKKLMEDIEKSAGSAAIRDFLVALEAENTLKKDFDKIIPRLITMGATTEEIKDILGNPMLMKSFVDEAATAEQITKRIERYLSAIKEGKAIDIKFNLKLNPEEAKNELRQKANDFFSYLERVAQREYKPLILAAELKITNKEKTGAQDVVDAIQKEIDDIQSGIDTEQRNIEEKITRKIEEYQEQINDLQRTIEIDFERKLAGLADESSALSEQLTLIDKAAEDINSKYDKQEEALQKISDINQDISNQKKQQIGLADALSRGDIAAAAQAAEEMRASQAEAASRRSGSFLQAARQAEIAGLRSPSGLTRTQIEERQYQIERESYKLNLDRKKIDEAILRIQDDIYKLEEDREEKVLAIRKQEDLIYDITKKRLDPAKKNLEIAEKNLAAVKEELDKRLANIEEQKDAWELAADAEFAAKVNAGEYNDVIEQTIAYLNQVLDLWKEIVGISSGGAYVAPRDTPESAAALDDFIKIVEELDAAQEAYDAAVESGNMYAVRNAGIALTAAQKAYDATLPKASPGAGSGGGGTNMAYMATGGFAKGTDTVPAMLTPGEFVINKKSAQKYRGLLDMINSNRVPQMLAKGGMVGRSNSFSSPSFGSPRSSLSGPSYKSNKKPMMSINRPASSPSLADNSTAVYNYNVGINVGGSSASPDAIAKAVMNEIRYVDSQRIRGQRA